jgi:hypothetical protein
MSNAIIIYNLEHAEAALSAAEDMDEDVTLISPPGAAATLGATVFRDIVAKAAERHPQARFKSVLDCGDEPGMAMGAFRHGIEGVRISNGPELNEKLADIAKQRGGFVYTVKGDELDLYAMGEPAAACRAWLTKPEQLN